MESQAEEMLSAQADRLENYPVLAAGIERHLQETRSQRERLARCLERRGTSSSGAKDFGARFSALLQGFGGSMAAGEVVRGVMANYAFEHFEAASYRVLINAARAAGDDETARDCEDSRREEEAMADWLAAQMPGLVERFLYQNETELSDAKH
jgi:ferritin-like metal-binding protein YciE